MQTRHRGSYRMRNWEIFLKHMLVYPFQMKHAFKKHVHLHFCNNELCVQTRFSFGLSYRHTRQISGSSDIWTKRSSQKYLVRVAFLSKVDILCFSIVARLRCKTLQVVFADTAADLLKARHDLNFFLSKHVFCYMSCSRPSCAP